jgi:hypothetical protein
MKEIKKKIWAHLLSNILNIQRLIHFHRLSFLPELTTEYDCINAAVEFCTLCQLRSRSAEAH